MPDHIIRQFSDSDTEGVVRLYNDVFAPLRPFHSWPISVERLRDKVLGCWEFDREGFWLACSGRRLIGFVLASCRTRAITENDSDPNQTAHVSAVAVDPRYRRRGIGRALCAKADEFARARGARAIAAFSNPMAPMAFFIGVEQTWTGAHAFLNAIGYDQKDSSQNLVQPLAGFELSAEAAAKIRQLQSQGYECRTCEERDFPSLERMLAGAWPFWQLDVLSKIGRWTRTRPFIETCFLDCSTDEIYGPDEIGIVAKDGEVLSYCVQTIGREKRRAYAGPVFTREDARCLGLGLVAVQLSLKRAAEKGAVLADVWTGTDAHRSHFYRKCGYQPMLRWLRFEKTLQRCPVRGPTEDGRRLRRAAGPFLGSSAKNQSRLLHLR